MEEYREKKGISVRVQTMEREYMERGWIRKRLKKKMRRA